ncbi:MAG: hypothetical protein H5T73_07795 [Actinobacteria bacterium]|nr:hypothetical protein [Actinomycetota bacterium]
MVDTAPEKQAQKWGMIAAGLAVLLLFHRWRQKRKVKKILKARAKVRDQAEKARRKAKGAEKAKGREKKKSKKGKERSLLEQLIRFAVFQLMKKVISEQIKQMEVDLSRGKLGKKLVEATEQA